MSYLGNTPTQQGFIPAVDFFSGNGITTAFTLSRPVASVAQVQATIENVPQNPGTAFTVSGNTITFDGAPPSGTNNIYVYYTSPITQVIAPSQGTVFPSTLSVPNALFWNTAGNVGIGTTSPAAKLHTQVSSGNTIARFVNTSSTVGELGELILAAPSRPAVRTNYQTSVDSNGFFNYDSGSFIWFNNSGGSATERMRIDSSGRVTMPTQTAFSVIGAGSGSLSAGSVFQFGAGGSSNLNFDVGSTWNSSTDRFTAPVAGTYMFIMGLYIQNATSTYQAIAPCVNGSQLSTGDSFILFSGGVANAGSTDNQVHGSFMLKLAANDYVDLRVRSGSNALTYYAGHSFFQGYLLG
jgi:hypothetical protein